METTLVYLGKTALATGAFYLAFLLLFQNRKQFSFNRIYLLVSLAVSFLIPLITFTTVKEIPAPVIRELPVEFNDIPVSVSFPEARFQWTWIHTLILLYAAGGAGFLVYLLAGHVKALRIIRKSIEKILFGTRVLVTGSDVHPFSFFRKIVIPREILQHSDLEMVVDHEKIHANENHTVDILLSELLFLFQWYNPFAWLMKDAVKSNLEYKTDDQVIRRWNMQTYQLAMVSLADKQGIAPFLTALNGSQLKNRIIMMKKKTENKFAAVRQLIILPLIAILVMGLSNREVKFKTIESNSLKNGVVIIETKDYDAPEKTIKGKVTLEGVPVPNVIVSIKGKPMYSYTDLEGNYSIEVEKSDEYLVFSRPGMETKEIRIGGQKTILVQLKPSPETNQKTETKVKEITKPGIEFSADRMEVDDKGKVTLNSSDRQKIKIDFNGDKSKQPLYLVNGIITEDISNVDPADIESVSVLKPESAVKLYSDKGKNGVVIIRLKKGKQPLYFIDGKETTENSIPDPDKIKSVTVLKEESAVKLYGERGKNGVVLIETKNPSDPVTVIGYGLKPDQKKPESQNPSEPVTVIGYPSRQDAKDPVFFIVEEMPEFPGGEKALKKLISETVQYPAEAIKYGIQGKVYVTFIIDKTGKIRDLKTTRSFDPLLNREALRVIGSLPDWKPGKQKGVPVNVSYTIPVDFVLPENKSANNNSLKNNKLSISDKTHTGTTFDGSQYVQVETEPEFPGGSEALLLFIKNSVQYPQSALDNKISGVVWVSFIVDSDGRIKNPAVARSVEPALDKEALRIVSTLPKWEPGRLNGKPVDVYNVVPVRFMLPHESYMVPAKDSLKDHKKPLYIVDGSVYYGNVSDIPVDEISNISVANDRSTKNLYGEKAKDGVIFISTKTKYNSLIENKVSPLVVVNSKISDKPFNSIDPNTIESVNILKGDQASENYGEKGKNGVIEVTLKNKTNKEIMLGSRNLATGSVKVTAGGKELSENIDYTVDYTKGVIKVINKDLLKSGAPLSVSTEGKNMFTGNKDEKGEEQVFFIVEKMPEFPGGETGLRKFIADAINYPKIAWENGIQGKVYVTFIIGKTGKVRDAKIARGVDPSLDREALRVVGSMPGWKPGMQKGVPVNVSYTVSVIFILLGDSQKAAGDISVNENRSVNGINSKTKYNSETDLTPSVVTKGNHPDKKNSEIDPANMENLTVVKGVNATKNYGDKKKSSVIQVYAKNDTGIEFNNRSSLNNEVFFIVEKMPEFPGGEIALHNFISGAIQYPEIAKENGISGKVYVTLVIDNTGKVKNPVIARGVDPALDKEALRVVNSLPDWTPGMQRGKPVNVSYTLPVEFKLPPGTHGDNLDDLELRKSIAREIRYPVKVQEQNQAGTIRLWMDVDKDGKITGISDEVPAGKFIAVNEVVVVAYGLSQNKENQPLSPASKQLLTEEVKRVFNKIAYIQNSNLHGKTVQISVQFALQ